ncbi:Nucleoside-transport system protein nupG [Raoultella terrigena]|uniref:Nucleoside-transport system protein nupG n=1 Tax=Raoultella terrigena TaxID=577 RepID=A0A3P8JD66_RAOTE|nr:Nucleoside-transport system protein nupG [Raoultella terrigena]
MNLKLQLKILSFLQFCLWGSWLTTLGSYMFVTLKFDGASIGAVYSSLGIAAVFMPTLLGIVADKWISAKWVYALCHLVGAGTLFMAAQVTTPGEMFLVILLNSLAYMPTLGLINTISYYRLKSAGLDIVADFPPIRIWGTIGFIMAMWAVSFAGFELSICSFYIGATLSVVLALFTLTLPHIPVSNQQKNQSWSTMLGLDAFALFKNKRMAIFFIFSMLLGAELQITNMFGNTFLHSFDNNPLFSGSFNRRACVGNDVDFPDLRNPVYPDHSVLPEPLRHQERHADQYRGVDAALRPVRLRRPIAVRHRAAGSVDDCLRLRLRLLQHLGFGVCRERGETGNSRQRPGDVPDDDQRLRLHSWRRGERESGGDVYHRRYYQLAAGYG